MSINHIKCSHITICNSSSPPTRIESLIDSTEIKQVKECKHWGLWSDQHLTLKTHMNKIVDKIQQHLYHIYFLRNSRMSLYPKTTPRTGKSKSRPCIEHASIFYFHKDKDDRIRTLQNKFIRAAYPCRQSTQMHT